MAKIKATAPLEPIHDERSIMDEDEKKFRLNQGRRWEDKFAVFNHPEHGWSMGVVKSARYIGKENEHEIPNFIVRVMSLKTSEIVAVNLVKRDVLFFKCSKKAETHRKLRHGR